jgi:hypothetical protein
MEINCGIHFTIPPLNCYFIIGLREELKWVYMLSFFVSIGTFVVGDMLSSG